MNRTNFFLLVILVMGFISCSRNISSVFSPVSASGTQHNASAPCIVYKTRTDYSFKVPVILDETRSAIASYPDIKDLKYQDKFAYPTQLSGGFLLDNRGINAHVAFLDYTYEEYSRLGKTPSAGQLMQHILDKDPLLEMYQCGQRNSYPDAVKEMNTLIKSGNLKSCKKIK